MTISPTSADGVEREVPDAEDARYRAMLAADTTQGARTVIRGSSSRAAMACT